MAILLLQLWTLFLYIASELFFCAAVDRVGVVICTICFLKCNAKEVKYLWLKSLFFLF